MKTNLLKQREKMNVSVHFVDWYVNTFPFCDINFYILYWYRDKYISVKCTFEK